MFDLLDDSVIVGILVFGSSWLAFDLLAVYLYLRKMNGGDKK